MKYIKVSVTVALISCLFFSTVSSTSDKIIITMQIGNKTAYINNQPTQMDAPPMIVPPGRTMVPIRFISEGLGAQVGWDGRTQQVTITMDSISNLKTLMSRLEEDNKLLKAEVEAYKKLEKGLELGQIATLNNGLQIIHKRFSEEKVTIALGVKAGAAYESQDRYGLSHLLEHIIARGIIEDCKKAGWEGFREGIDANAYTDIEVVTYHLSCYTKDLEKALRIFYQNLTRPDYSLLEQEMEMVARETSFVSSNPAGAIVHELDRLIFSYHPYGNRGRGMNPAIFEKTRRELTLREIEDFHSAFYGAERMVLVIAGDVVVDKAMEIFSGLTRSKTTVTIPALTKLPQKRESVRNVYIPYTFQMKFPDLNPPIDMSFSPSYMCLGWIGFPEQESLAFNLLGEILFDEAKGKMRSEMLKNFLMGPTYYMGFNPTISGGIFQPGISRFMATFNLDLDPLLVRPLLFKVIREVRDNLTEGELIAAKYRLKTDTLASFENSYNFAFTLAHNVPFLGFSFFQNIWGDMDKIGIAEVKRAAAFLTEDSYAIIVLRSQP